MPPHGEPFQFSNLNLTGLSAESFYCLNAGIGANNQPFNPVPKALRRSCLVNNKTGAADIGQWKVPASTVANWDEGLRFHTSVGSAELTAFYWNAWND